MPLWGCSDVVEEVVLRVDGKSRIDDDIDIKLQIRQKDDSKRIFKVKLSALKIIGMSAYLGWIFCIFWSPSIFPSTLADASIQLVRIGLAIGMMVAYIIFGVFAEFLSRKKRKFAILAGALVLPPLCCVGSLVGEWANLALLFSAWGIGGIGTAALLMMWSRPLAVLNRKQLLLTDAAAFFLGSFLYLSTSFLPFPVPCILIAVLPVLSLMLAHLTASKTPDHSSDITVSGSKKDRIILDEAESLGVEDGGDAERISFLRTVFLALAYSVGIGFVGSCATVSELYPNNVYIITAGNAIAGIGTIIFFAKKSRNIMTLLTEVFLPCVLVCIFLFSISGYSGQLICLFFLFVIFACHDSIETASISSKAELFEKDPIRTFAFGRTLNGVGAVFGWIAGYVMNFQFSSGTTERVIVCFALVVFLVVVASFAVFHPGIYSLYQKARGYEKTDGKSYERELRKKAQVIASKVKLTSRQEEVLYYLAQGRNSEYVSQKLYISNHTAKSHIYSIYAKLQIHSQQELLDIFENTNHEELNLSVHEGY